MWIQVKFNCGDSIEDAARDMCALADRLGFGVEADFNGVALLANPHGDAAALASAYKAELRRVTAKRRWLSPNV